MSRLKRYHRPGDIVFVTAVTRNRAPLLVPHAGLLLRAIWSTRERLPFESPAFCIMPDHFHMIIDPGARDLSKIMARIKLSFLRRLRGERPDIAGPIWQRRFWDHILRDQEDVNRHIDYIHFNPVKHGLTESPFVWPLSSAQEYLNRGVYTKDWGAREDLRLEGDFGE